MKKRDRPKSGGGRAPRPAAPKRTSSQTFAADQAEAVIDRYAEACGMGTACTEIGCSPWVTTCEDSVCGLERETGS